MVCSSFIYANLVVQGGYSDVSALCHMSSLQTFLLLSDNCPALSNVCEAGGSWAAVPGVLGEEDKCWIAFFLAGVCVSIELLRSLLGWIL